ncbi:MAG: farnesyl diphosphate synthase [Cyanobacteriota bacterium]|nr:farnesyl diphosphate synthase [Cyanobacteriota bacterium]
MVSTDERIAPSGKNSAFELATYLAQRKTLVEEALSRSLPVVTPEKIYEAMRYSLMAGGKRLRPILCLATCELLGGTIEMAMPTACALEMVHTMSLIHDDLPAMDNDDYRRGQLTNHKVFGEDIAILAGDGLLAYAFEYMAEETKEVPAERLLGAIARLGRAVGAAGLVGGQTIDLESEGKSDISLETLRFIHTHKTGALLEACVTSGAILAGAPAEDLQKVSNYANNIGLAFQIVDDILDITATPEELGKTAGKDCRAQKATFPSVLGLEASKQEAERLIEEAINELASYGEPAEPLRAIAHFITARKH